MCCRLCPFAIMHQSRVDFAWIIRAFWYSRVCVCASMSVYLCGHAFLSMCVFVLACNGMYAGVRT